MPVTVLVEKIDKLDQVQQWRQKSNTFVQALGQAATIISDAESLNELFIQDVANTSGFSFAVTSGKIRNRADITDIAAAILVLPDSQLNYVYIDVTDNTIKSSIIEPEEKAIPLYQVTTDTIGITLIEDKRTWATINTDTELVEAFPLIEVFHISEPIDIITLTASKTINSTVYVDGFRKVVSDDYIILSETEIKFPSPLSAGTTVIVAGTVPETEVKSFTSVDFKIATTDGQTEFNATSTGQLTTSVAVWVDGIRQHDYIIDTINNKVILAEGVPSGTEVLMAKIELRGGLFDVYDGNNGDIVYKIGNTPDVWDFGAPAFDSITIISGVFDPARIPAATVADISDPQWLYMNDRYITPDILDEMEEGKKLEDWNEVTFAKVEDFYLTGFNGRSVVGNSPSYSQSPIEIKCVRHGRVIVNPETLGTTTVGALVRQDAFGAPFIKNAPFMIEDSVMIRDPAVRFSAPKMVLVGEYKGTRLAVLPNIDNTSDWVEVPTPFGAGWEIVGLGSYNYDDPSSLGDEVIFVSGYNKTTNTGVIYRRAAIEFPSGTNPWILYQTYSGGPTNRNNKPTKFASHNSRHSGTLMWGVRDSVYAITSFVQTTTSPVSFLFNGLPDPQQITCVACFVVGYNSGKSGTADYSRVFFAGDSRGTIFFDSTENDTSAIPGGILSANIIDESAIDIGMITHIAPLTMLTDFGGVAIFGENGSRLLRIKINSAAQGFIENLEDSMMASLPIQQAVASMSTYYGDLTTPSSISDWSKKTLLQDKNGDFAAHAYWNTVGGTDIEEMAAGCIPLYHKAFTHKNSPATLVDTKKVVRGNDITMVATDQPVNTVWISGKNINYAKPIPDTILDIHFIGNAFFILTSTKCHYSVDGINWTVSTFADILNTRTSIGSIYPMAYGNGVWIIADYNKSKYSTNGTTWIEMAEDLVRVDFDGTQFVALTDLDTIVTSPDGIVWTTVGSSILSGQTYPLVDLIYNDYYGFYIGINSNAGVNNDIFTSEDLINWTSCMPHFIETPVKLVGKGKHVFLYGYQPTLTTAITTNNVLLSHLDNNALPYTERANYNVMPLGGTKGTRLNNLATEITQDGNTFLVGVRRLNIPTGKPPVYYEISL